MSPTPPHPARDTIPVGDIELHDHYLPGLPAGDYRVEVAHTLRTGLHDDAQVVGTAFTATQRFTVRAPQVSVDTTTVVARQPPDSSAGRYAEVLPHLVLGDPMLPWERALRGASRDTPWLALLVLTDDQFVGGTDSPTRTVSGTVRDFLAPDDAIRKPALTLESDIDAGDPCVCIQVTTTAFQAVAPQLAELRFLAHCRGANTGDRPILGIVEDGLFSVVTANRFPVTAQPGSPGDDGTGTKNIVHLVSLEGHEAILAGSPEFGGHTSVALLSLCSWSFLAYPDRKADFADLAEGLAGTPDGGRASREDMWLRLPSPYQDTDGVPAAERQVARRIHEGYVPLAYRTRSGEDTYGWYRGPFAPVVPLPTDRAAQATAADALIGYDPVWGSFDVSLATAFETGRALALADASYAQNLVAFKQAARHLVDTLHHRDTSTHLPPDGATRPLTVRDAFGALLDGDLVTALGRLPTRPDTPWSPPTPDAPAPDPAAELDAFLRSDAARQALTAALNADDGLRQHLAPLTQWLARLLLLLPVPFTHLVPDERMLPKESLRFFHTDPTWTAALVSGALSIGAQSSRDTLQDQLVAATLRDAAATAAAEHRDTLRGVAPDRGGSAGAPACGLLLRSELVSGWPNLAVRANGPAGEPLPALRMDRLSSTVLLCLFDRVPATVELAEPQEGFRFGVEDHGLIPLRNMSAPPGSPRGLPLGEQIGPDVTFAVFDHLRAGDDRVLDIGSLVPALGAALDAAHGTAVSPIGPADLAMQMVKVPEAIRFTGPDGA